MKIDSDFVRFKKIIERKVKNNFDKFISNDNVIKQSGSKVINIPISSMTIPKFTFGNKNGSISTGAGNIGDPIFSNKKPGAGKPGDDDAEPDFSADFTPDELAEILIEHLELPDLEHKDKGDLSSEKSKYNSIANQGVEALRHNKRTFKEALKREIASGTYNPYSPKIVPIKDDKRYKSYSIDKSPDINAVAIYICDYSGSMEEEQRNIVKAQVFWIDLLLKHSYKDIESVFIIHDTKAHQVSKEEFFKVSSNGGTRISPAYELCYDLIQKEYPYSSYNNYAFHFTDGDNNHSDNVPACEILGGKILPNCNRFCYGQVKSNMGSGEFMDFLEANFKAHKKLALSHIGGAYDILKSIKDFFGDKNG